MDELRRHFEALGLPDVATFIASGNVVFRLPDPAPEELESRIEHHLAGALGYEVATFVRSLSRLGQLADLGELEEARRDGFNPHVIFLRGGADRSLHAALASLETSDDRFLVLGREIVWLRRGRLSDSTVPQRDLGTALAGMPTTMRNLNTIERMVRKFVV